jgi:g-D-glutamyl-meso-diaminopimelate peptidase
MKHNTDNFTTKYGTFKQVFLHSIQKIDSKLESLLFSYHISFRRTASGITEATILNIFFDESIPLDYERFCTATDLLKKTYKNLTSFSIGKTVLGRNITAFILGSGKPGALYVGGVHALEYITSMLLLKFTAELCENDASQNKITGFNLKKLLASRSIYMIPMLNPDGIEIHLHGADSAGALCEPVRRIALEKYQVWQANAHGVDLNHNFNAGFDMLRQEEIKNGIAGPAPRQYGGGRPESEPETHALCELCRRMFFSKTFAFHSQGEEIYWYYGERTPHCALDMAKALASASGYTVSHPEGMASNGGFKDWFICTFGRPGFTVEVGRGVNPLPVSALNDIYRKLFNMLVLGLFV